MSLITRCPACLTLFRVVSDQLRISGGWVRCGQCDEIFDASQHLLSDTAETPVPLVDSRRDTAATDHGSDEAPIESAPWPPKPVAQTVPEQTQFLDSEPERFIESNDVTFLRNKAANARWQKPIIRVIFSLLSLALLLGLTGQIVFHERNRIVALQPALRPWLQAFCRPLNCGLSALQDKNSIVIDSASFTKMTGDSYRLNFMLKNNADTTLAMPAVELTLTDSADQPVVRRVLLPSELELAPDILAAGSERSTSLTMAVKLPATGQQIVGYRLYAFYP